MNKLIAQLRRLYLPDNALSRETLEQHVTGKATLSISLTADDGSTRAVVIAFDKIEQGEQTQHWTVLCAVANALQTELGLPAPAVSISGAHGYRLWLSLEAAVPAALARQFVELLRNAYFPEMDVGADGLVELPPCLHQATGLWAAFIHPGLGSSFADESGLDMAPPFAGQAALLEGVKSITEAQFQHAMARLTQDGPAAESLPAPRHSSTAQGLLLKDATLEEIVKHLHGLGIEPTFRHILRDR